MPNGGHSASLFDRYFGMKIGDLAHAATVNSVALEGATQGVAATASDDMTVKIWRSREVMNKVKQSHIDLSSGQKKESSP